MSKKTVDTDYKDATDDPAPTHDGQQLDPEGGPPAPEGQYHGLTPEQVAKIEAARGDKEPSLPPEPPPPPDYSVPEPGSAPTMTQEQIDDGGRRDP